VKSISTIPHPGTVVLDDAADAEVDGVHNIHDSVTRQKIEKNCSKSPSWLLLRRSDKLNIDVVVSRLVG